LLAEFRRAYALPDGKVVGRVAPPFSPGRLEYYRVHEPVQAQAYPDPQGCMRIGWGGLTTAYDESGGGRLHAGWFFSDDHVRGLVTYWTDIKS
jgi:hypothetical protein